MCRGFFVEVLRSYPLKSLAAFRVFTLRSVFNNLRVVSILPFLEIEVVVQVRSGSLVLLALHQKGMENVTQVGANSNSVLREILANEVVITSARLRVKFIFLVQAPAIERLLVLPGVVKSFATLAAFGRRFIIFPL